MKGLAHHPESISTTGGKPAGFVIFGAKALIFRAAIKSQAVIRPNFKKHKNNKLSRFFLKSFWSAPLMISTAVALHTPGKANQS
ncbi:hypothetical protein [Zoogloea sp.]|uniref:hypothetical protein n=1 Tax=Zoogloea sp. TaxID=49181 RepID=UPI0035B3B62C